LTKLGPKELQRATELRTEIGKLHSAMGGWCLPIQSRLKVFLKLMPKYFDMWQPACLGEVAPKRFEGRLASASLRALLPGDIVQFHCKDRVPLIKVVVDTKVFTTY